MKYYDTMFVNYPDVLEVKDVQKMLGVGRHTVYDLIGSGELFGLKIGKSYRIPKIKVIEYLCTNPADAVDKTV